VTVRRLGVVLGVGVLLTLTSLGDAEARRRGRKPHKKSKHAPAAATSAPAESEAAVADAPDAPDVEKPAAPGAGAAATPAAAAKAGPADSKKPKGPKVMDFTGLAVEGKLRTPQLLYFLGRVKEELQRASLENRSFMPELVRSVDEGAM